MVSYTFNTIDPPSASFTVVEGINASGEVVGRYIDISTQQHAFLYDGGNFTTIDAPGLSGGSDATSINASGEIVGSYTDSSGVHGFVYDGGHFTTIDAIQNLAGSKDLNGLPLKRGETWATNINASGEVVGFYEDSAGEHGFVYKGNTVTSFSPPPGNPDFEPRSINDSG
jgi:probable HAF family extracellular repeat protein